jgi:L-threonylcarbamoyladenylate synthase
MIDGGRLPGTASTVIDLVSLTIIRPGADLEQVLAYISARE